MARVQFYVTGLREMMVRAHVAEDGRLRFRPVYPDMVWADAPVDAPEQPRTVHEYRLRHVEGHGPEPVWTVDVLSVADPEAPVYRVHLLTGGGTLGADISEATLGGDYSGEAYPYRRADGRPVLPYVLYHAVRPFGGIGRQLRSDRRPVRVGDARQGWCEVTRRGEAPQRRTFSVADAKRAGLWGKSGPWTQYPDRMLQLRARGFAIRDVFPDALRGVMTREEAEDMPAEPRHVENLAAAPVAPAPEPVDAPLLLIGPDTKEYAFKVLPTWLAAAKRAISQIDPDALGAWRDANSAHIVAVSKRFPDVPVVETIIAAIDHRHEYAETQTQEPAQ